MAKFRKRPVVIEASQWFENGGHPLDGQEVFVDANGGSVVKGEGKVVRYYRRPDDPGTRECQHCARTMHNHGWIDTLEGGHIVCPGDWVITGVASEMYPCKNDIFVKSYEPVGE